MRVSSAVHTAARLPPNQGKTRQQRQRFANRSLPWLHNVSSAFIRSELENVTFIHRLAFHKIDAVDDAISCDPLNSGQRFSDSSVFGGEQVTFLESHSVLLRNHPAHR